MKEPCIKENTDMTQGTLKTRVHSHFFIFYFFTILNLLFSDFYILQFARFNQEYVLLNVYQFAISSVALRRTCCRLKNMERKANTNGVNPIKLKVM